MIEVEKRFKITPEKAKEIESRFDNWSSYKLIDLVFGPTGETSVITHGWIIRLRKKDEKVMLQYKEAKNKDMTEWEELSLQIDDIKTASVILTKMGLTHGVVIDRLRKTVKTDKFEIVLDDIFLMGNYVEIEKLDESQNFGDIIEFLGLDVNDEALPYGLAMSKLLIEKPEFRKDIDKYFQNM
ncbi:MAG: CYTH domain-containing protein [Lactobacillus sp.]|jgi:predicted adenylyl cyclase CyaB|nr:CYTH domain-containing protein [Lactobacillus sp.]